MNTQGAYVGLCALDLGQGVAAPYWAMLLAMHGAGVVKLEPLAGDCGAAILAEIGIDPATIASLCAEKILPIPKAS